jgi:hypothetical protein
MQMTNAIFLDAMMQWIFIYFSNAIQKYRYAKLDMLVQIIMIRVVPEILCMNK